jgi:hypothetical protein
MSGAFDTRAAARHGCHVTNSSAPNTPISGPDLLRANNLQVEGPILWGHPVGGNVPGVFIVELPAPHPTVQIDATAVRDWLARVPGLTLDGKKPTVGELQSRLASYWLPGQAILYIGSSKKSVASRLLAMSRTTLGERRPQPVGYWLQVLKDLPKARIWWAASSDPELDEDQLVEQFVKGAGSLPFGVLAAPGGQHRDHGIAGALRPGGGLILFDVHPSRRCLDVILHWREDYFAPESSEGLRLWRTGEIVMAISSAGLRLRAFDEFPGERAFTRFEQRVPADLLVLAERRLR